MQLHFKRGLISDHRDGNGQKDFQEPTRRQRKRLFLACSRTDEA